MRIHKQRKFYMTNRIILLFSFLKYFVISKLDVMRNNGNERLNGLERHLLGVKNTKNLSKSHMFANTPKGIGNAPHAYLGVVTVNMRSSNSTIMHNLLFLKLHFCINIASDTTEQNISIIAKLFPKHKDTVRLIIGKIIFLFQNHPT